MEWEILLTTQVEEFLDGLYETDRDSHRLVNQAILVLERSGPSQGRPLVDTITASHLPNMKEPAAAVNAAVGDQDPVRVRPVALGRPTDRRRQVRSVERLVPAGDPRRRATV